MNYLIFIVFVGLGFVRLSYLAVAFPVLCFFTPNGMGLIDVAALPYLSLNRALALSMMALYLLHVMAGRFRIRKVAYPLAGAFALLTLAYFMSLAANPALISTNLVTAFISVAELFFPAYLLCYVRLTPEQAQRLLTWIYWTGVAVAAYGILTYVIGANPFLDYMQHTTPTGRVMATDYEGTVRGVRGSGTLSHPITYGAFLVMTFCVGLFRLRHRASMFNVTTTFAGFMVLMLGIAVSNSRTPLIFLGTALALMVCGFQNRHRLVMLQVCMVMVIAAAVLGGSYLEQIIQFTLSVFNSSDAANMNGSSVDMRWGQLLIAIKFYLDAPFFGGGVQQTRDIVASGAYPAFYNAESALFQWGIDLGSLGLIAYTTLFVKVFRMLKGRLSERYFRAVGLGMTGGYLLFILATGVLNTMQFFLCVVTLMWLAQGQNGRQDTQPAASPRPLAGLPAALPKIVPK